MVVLLSPASSAKVWYRIDKENYRLTIYGSRPIEVSYRLTAPRFDWEKWTNYSHDDVTGFVLNNDETDLELTPSGEASNGDIEENISQFTDEDKNWIIGLVRESFASIISSISGQIKTAGEWVFEKITAALVKTNNLEAQTAKISGGLEMADELTGQIYCVRIRGGELVKREGRCGENSWQNITPEANASPAEGNNNQTSNQTNNQIEQNSSGGTESAVDGNGNNSQQDEVVDEPPLLYNNGDQNASSSGSSVEEQTNVPEISNSNENQTNE
jgi:hypothetical protein